MIRPTATPDAAAPHIAAVLAAQASAPQPESSFRAIDRALAATTGHILFTIMVHHPGLKAVERYYSNMPNAYPLGGRKPVNDTPWMHQVVNSGLPFLGYSREDIRRAFFDYELIWSLGCESVLNIPVRWEGKTLGTVNLLHKADWYREDDIPNARLFAALALPALMLLSRR